MLNSHPMRGVTGSVGITRHARAAQMAGLRSSQSHSLVAYSRAHLLVVHVQYMNIQNVQYMYMYVHVYCKCIGPHFNPGWLPVFHSSLKIFRSLFMYTCSPQLYCLVRQYKERQVSLTP